MYEGQTEKLARYLRNSERFLWGIFPGTKKAVLEQLTHELKSRELDKGIALDYRKATYDTITGRLLDQVGIEKLIVEVVAPHVHHAFAARTGALDFLRSHWMAGSVPRWQTLQGLRGYQSFGQRVLAAVNPPDDRGRGKRQTSDIIDAFAEVNTQYQYVHGWTTFAGLWFEEIEPLLGEGRRKRPDAGQADGAV